MDPRLSVHLDTVKDLPEELRRTLASVAGMDERLDRLRAHLDSAVAALARVRPKYRKEKGKEDAKEKNRTRRGRPPSGRRGGGGDSGAGPADGCEGCERMTVEGRELKAVAQRIGTRTRNASNAASRGDEAGGPTVSSPAGLRQPTKQANGKGGRGRGRGRGRGKGGRGDEAGGPVAGCQFCRWRTVRDEAVKGLKQAMDLSMRLCDEKMVCVQVGYDLLDTTVRHADRDLKALEAKLRRWNVLPAETAATQTTHRKRRRAESNGDSTLGAGGTAGQQVEFPVDPNEPVYCLCKQVAFGDMVGCDNPECQDGDEWYHFGCVDLKKQPNGRWHCPGCTSRRKKA